MYDTLGSSALRTLNIIGLMDAWGMRGNGYCATIHRQLPYRIDYIMYSAKSFQLRFINKVIVEKLSDHDALCAIFCFNQ